MTHRRLRRFGIGSAFALIVGGCQTSPEVAFPTAETVAHTGGGRGAEISVLAVGRKIYTTSCTECHVARPIAERSVAQWRQMVNVMAPRANLKPGDRDALETYLVAARQSLPHSETSDFAEGLP